MRGKREGGGSARKEKVGEDGVPITRVGGDEVLGCVWVDGVTEGATVDGVFDSFLEFVRICFIFTPD